MKKSTSYRETFRQHRLVLSLPILLAVVIAAWFVLGAAKSYESTASLWVDNSAPAASSVGNANPALTPPSTIEEDVLTELIATKSFVLAVGHDSLLAPYLASHASSGFSPTALFGGPGSLNKRILGAFGPKQLTTAVPGPQVLQINYSGPTPAVAQSTLNEIVRELLQQTNSFGQAHNQSALTYYRIQIDQATQALNNARAQLDAYRTEHPTAGATDPNLTALQTAVTNANANLTTANENLTGASAGPNSSSGLTIQVLDPASTPLGPSSGKKKALEGILGGLFAGMLISFLGTVLLTRGKSDPWEDELAAGQAPTRNGAAVRGAGVAVASQSRSGGPPPPPTAQVELPAMKTVPSTSERRFVLPAPRSFGPS